MIVRLITNLWADMFGPIFAVLANARNHRKRVTNDDKIIGRLWIVSIGATPPASAAMLTHIVHAEMKLLERAFPVAEEK